MLKLRLRWLAVTGFAALASVSTVSRADTLMTFEEFLGSDTAPISTFYDGVTFTNVSGGAEWVARDATTGNYNVSSYPSGTILGGSGEYWVYGGVGATTSFDDFGFGGKISFDNGDASYVELGYTTGSLGGLFLEAYNSLDVLIDLDSGPANRRFLEGNSGGPGTLRVDAPLGQQIAYVIVHDEGNFWVVDNVKTDATGITGAAVPTPSAGLAGLVLIGSLVGAKQLKKRRNEDAA